MVLDCLVDCKTAATTYMTVATEASQPQLRRTLADIARQHLESAYELYKIAEQHGWYPSLKPQESPEEWLRSTHLPPSHQEASQFGTGYASANRGSTYTGATGGISESYSSRGYAQTQSGYGRTAAGANYGYGASGREESSYPGHGRSVQYASPDLESEQIRRH
jgi:hypothetical protein